MPKVRVPHNYEPRHYQLPVLQALSEGCTRLVWVAHRRSGKDKTLAAEIAAQMLDRVGTYWGVFPELKQGRKILWEGMDSKGFKFLDHFPRELRDGDPNNSDMLLRYKNGSIFQIVGDDNIDSNVGSNPIFVWFDEYSLHSPRGWGLISPILEENGGTAIFTYTPRGENHGLTLLNLAKSDPNWFWDVVDAGRSGVFSKEQLERIRREYIAFYGDDSLYWQEYWCDFSVPIAGAYYAKQIKDAETQGRVTNLVYNPTYPVDTYWDIGRTDYTTVWFCQQVGQQYRFIDYLETTGVGIHEIAPMVLSRKYVFRRHVAPHDIRQGEWGSPDKSRLDTASKLGISFEIAPKLMVQDGIDSCRGVFSQCWFDSVKCKDGLSALKSYHKEYDDKTKRYLSHPHHDWSSHGADGFRTFAVSVDDRAQARPIDKYEEDSPRAGSKGYFYAGRPDAC